MLLDEKRKALRASIEQLPDQMRKCLTLRVYQELDRELGRIGCSERRGDRGGTQPQRIECQNQITTCQEKAS